MASSNSPVLTTGALSLLFLLVSASPSPLANADTQSVSSPSVDGNRPSSRSSGSTGGWSGSAGSTSSYWQVPSNLDTIRVAHVLLGACAVLLILPFGGVYVRLFGLKQRHGPWVHGSIQLCGYLVYCTAAGLGIWMAKSFSIVGGSDEYIHPKLYHPIIGMILLALGFFQPFTELANHFLFYRYPKVQRLAYVHIWFGRFLLLLGIINGGLGFAFADQIPGNTWSMAPRVSYGVIATVVVFTYVVIISVWPNGVAGRRMSKTSDRVRDEEMQGLSQQHLGESQLGPSGGTDSRPQTAQTTQTAQTDSTTGDVFKSSAL